MLSLIPLALVNSKPQNHLVEHLKNGNKVHHLVNKRPTGLIAPPFIIGFLNTENLPKVKTLLKITHLASRKSCLVIICPNSYEKLTKVKSGQIGVGLNSAQNHSPSL